MYTVIQSGVVEVPAFKLKGLGYKIFLGLYFICMLNRDCKLCLRAKHKMLKQPLKNVWTTVATGANQPKFRMGCFLQSLDICRSSAQCSDISSI